MKKGPQGKFEKGEKVLKQRGGGDGERGKKLEGKENVDSTET